MWIHLMHAWRAKGGTKSEAHSFLAFIPLQGGNKLLFALQRPKANLLLWPGNRRALDRNKDYPIFLYLFLSILTAVRNTFRASRCKNKYYPNCHSGKQRQRHPGAISLFLTFPTCSTTIICQHMMAYAGWALYTQWEKPNTNIMIGKQRNVWFRVFEEFSLLTNDNKKKIKNNCKSPEEFEH